MPQAMCCLVFPLCICSHPRQRQRRRQRLPQRGSARSHGTCTPSAHLNGRIQRGAVLFEGLLTTDGSCGVFVVGMERPLLPCFLPPCLVTTCCGESSRGVLAEHKHVLFCWRSGGFWGSHTLLLPLVALLGGRPAEQCSPNQCSVAPCAATILTHCLLPTYL